MTQEFKKRFLTNTDDTGRFVVTSLKTGKTYYVEPIGGAHIEWGSYNPATGNIEHKKGDGKHKGSITEAESLITKENGFEEITYTGVGASPFSEIERRDKEYELLAKD